MKAKNLMIGGVAAMALGGLALIPLATSVSADEVNSPDTTFIQKLAEKLGLSTESVQTAVESSRSEMQAEREAERESAIADAVTAGTLTQRQADILNAIDDAMRTIHGNKTEEEREAMRDLTPEERKAQMESELVDALNAAGLNTTADEIQTARDTAHDADILPMGGQGMRRGLGGPRF